MASCSRVIIRLSPKISSRNRPLSSRSPGEKSYMVLLQMEEECPPSRSGAALPLFRGMRLVPQKACLAELDIDIAELDKTNHQQHNAYAGHAQDIAPIQDAENRVAIQMEDRDLPDPG